MQNIQQSGTDPLCRGTSDHDPLAPVFILASEADARLRAAQGAMVVGVVRARGIPALMPCCRHYPPITPEVTIVMMDLCLATWGGGMKAAGMTTLFQGDIANDFWSLVAHVDSFGVAHLHGWRGQAEKDGVQDGALKTADTVLLYRAATTWWMNNQPAWHGEREVAVTASVNVFSRILRLLLSTDHDLHMHAQALNGALCMSADPIFQSRGAAGNAISLLKERQDLLTRGLEWPLPFQEEASAQYFLKTIKVRSRAMTGETTRIYRRGRESRSVD